MTFKNDDAVLIDALARFKDKRGFFLQSVTDDQGTLVLGQIDSFENQKELSRVVWNKPGSELHIAILIDEKGVRLTYKGKKFITTYSAIDTNPVLEYLQTVGVKYKSELDFENLDLEIEKLQNQIKNAS
jgi:hypothetical protein